MSCEGEILSSLINEEIEIHLKFHKDQLVANNGEDIEALITRNKSAIIIGKLATELVSFSRVARNAGIVSTNTQNK